MLVKIWRCIHCFRKSSYHQNDKTFCAVERSSGRWGRDWNDRLVFSICLYVTKSWSFKKSSKCVWLTKNIVVTYSGEYDIWTRPVDHMLGVLIVQHMTQYFGHDMKKYWNLEMSIFFEETPKKRKSNGSSQVVINCVRNSSMVGAAEWQMAHFVRVSTVVFYCTWTW